jgi:predicted metal-dependent hydrolase
MKNKKLNKISEELLNNSKNMIKNLESSLNQVDYKIIEENNLEFKKMNKNITETFNEIIILKGEIDKNYIKDGTIVQENFQKNKETKEIIQNYGSKEFIKKENFELNEILNKITIESNEKISNLILNYFKKNK